MEESILKLKNTDTKTAFQYGYLLQKMFPYIKKVLSRTILLVLLAIPLGLLDGVIAFSLRPYMDYVVNGNETQTFDLSDCIDVDEDSLWSLCSDKVENETVTNNIATLEVGDNTYYVFVTDKDNLSKWYTLKIRRKPVYFLI